MKNTHLTGLLGLLGVLAGVLTTPGVSTVLTSILPPNVAGVVSAGITLVGAIAAYQGRPVSVPTTPVTTAVVAVPQLTSTAGVAATYPAAETYSAAKDVRAI